MSWDIVLPVLRWLRNRKILARVRIGKMGGKPKKGNYSGKPAGN